MKYRGYIWAGLYVEDMDASIKFYTEVLGLRFLDKGLGWAHLDAGDGALFELFGGGSASSQGKKAEEQSLVLGLRVDDLDDAVRELKNKGVAFIGEADAYAGTRWAHFLDNEGNQLEIKEIS